VLTPHRYTPRHPQLDPLRRLLASPLIGLVPVAAVALYALAQHFGLA
jgi:hypothetical protein